MITMLVQDAGEKLKSSQHERAALQKQRDALARQLAHVAEKISSGMIPDVEELAVPEHIAAAAEASASAVGLYLCSLLCMMAVSYPTVADPQDVPSKGMPL